MNIERITYNPAVMGGGLDSWSTRDGRDDPWDAGQAYPYLEAEDIEAALTYAAWRLEEGEEPLVVA